MSGGKANVTLTLIKSSIEAQGGNAALQVILARSHLESCVFCSRDTMEEECGQYWVYCDKGDMIVRGLESSRRNLVKKLEVSGLEEE